MKNIHVLPTEKPSRLSDSHNNKLYLNDVRYLRNYKHIYITSDEEIKEGDWVIDDENDILEVIEIERNQGLARSVNFTYVLESCKKIILTTDQDLIKDGVQAIDDEFLEWFVKNSSCERVEVVLDDTSFVISDIIYKIIIPKEEPKQHVEFINNNIDQLDKAIESFKQKTLEEAAEKYSINQFPLKDFNGKQWNNHRELCKIDFINGAKWQQEQDKKMYSEEVYKLLCDLNYDLQIYGVISLEEWFKQFKSK